MSGLSEIIVTCVLVPNIILYLCLHFTYDIHTTNPLMNKILKPSVVIYQCNKKIYILYKLLVLVIVAF